MNLSISQLCSSLLPNLLTFLALLSGAACETVTAQTLGEALNATNLVWTTGGNAPWLIESTNTHDRLLSARSGAITNSQESWTETTVTGPGSLSFW